MVGMTSPFPSPGWLPFIRRICVPLLCVVQWDMKNTMVSRSALYELLWTIPITKLAIRFEVTPADIVRIADAASIPRPQVGYWTQLAHGKAPERTPLPPCNDMDDSARHVLIEPSKKRFGPKKRDFDFQIENDKQKSDLPHQYTVQTRRSVEELIPEGEKELVYQNRRKSPSIEMRVCKHSLERSLAFLDQLCKAAARYGPSLEEMDIDGLKIIAFRCSGEVVTFKLIEKVHYRALPSQRDDHLYRKEYEFISTGKLEFHFERPINVHARFKWADGSIQRIETLIPGILDSAEFIGAEKYRVRIEREERERKWQEEAELRELRRRQQEVEKQRREQLLQSLNRWRTAQELKEFADYALQESNKEVHGPEVAEWAKWVRDVADEINPLIDSDPPWTEWKII